MRGYIVLPMVIPTEWEFGISEPNNSFLAHTHILVFIEAR